MATSTDKWGCICCEDDGPEPTLEEVVCGFTLAKTEFDASVRASIPDVAEDMRWLKQRVELVQDGEEHISDLCALGNASDGNVDVLNTYEYYDVVVNTTKDPDDSCSESYTYAGTGLDRSVTYNDPCSDPPDTGIDTDRNADGTVVLSGGVAKMSWVQRNPADSDYINSLPSALDHGPDDGEVSVDSLTLSTTGTVVLQATSNSWNYTHGASNTKYVGNEDIVIGYSEPHFRFRVTVPDEADVLYSEAEIRVYFTPDGGSESLASTEVVEWEDGDPTREFEFTPTYTDFGTWRVKLWRYRRHPLAMWTIGTEELDTSS